MWKLKHEDIVNGKLETILIDVPIISFVQCWTLSPATQPFSGQESTEHIADKECTYVRILSFSKYIHNMKPLINANTSFRTNETRSIFPAEECFLEITEKFRKMTFLKTLFWDILLCSAQRSIRLAMNTISYY